MAGRGTLLRLRIALFVFFLVPHFTVLAQKKSAPPPPRKEELSGTRAAAKALLAQGDADRAQKKLDDAEIAYMHAISMFPSEEVNPELVAALDSLTELYTAEGRREDALDAALTTMQAARLCGFPANKPQGPQSCVNTAIRYVVNGGRYFLEMRDYKSAEPLIRQAYDVGRAGSLPPALYLTAMQQFLKLLEETSQPAQAAVIRPEINEMYAAGRFGPKPKGASAPPPLVPLFPAGDPHPAPALTSLKDRTAFFDTRLRFAFVDSQFGLLPRTEANMRAAIAQGQAEPPVDHVRVAGAMRGLANLLFENRKRAEALEATRQVLDFVSKQLPPNSMELPQAHLDLGSQLLHERQHDEALTQFDLAVATAKQCAPQDMCDKIRLQALAFKAFTLLGDGEFAKAEPIVKPLLDASGKIPPDLFRALIESYADSLRSAGRTDDAKAAESKLRP